MVDYPPLRHLKVGSLFDFTTLLISYAIHTENICMCHFDFSLASTCLSVNQASSIQSIGGTCESITIGHNKSKVCSGWSLLMFMQLVHIKLMSIYISCHFAKLPLSHKAIYLKSYRPLFLSEKILDSIDAHEDLVRQRTEKWKEEKERKKKGFKSYLVDLATIGRQGEGTFMELSMSRSRQAKTTRSSASLLGAYVNLERGARRKRARGNTRDTNQAEHVSHIIATMIKERQGIENARRFFHRSDVDGDGFVSLEEFIAAYQKADNSISSEHLEQLFIEADIDCNGTLSFEEFVKVSRMPSLLAELVIKNRDSRGLVQVQASRENYFGEELRSKYSQLGSDSMALSQSQHLAMELYESRIASMQRFVAMTVMFHQMGMRVQTFFPNISFGLLGYRMDRTHSIMRIATTASPVSGADVREKMEELRIVLKIEQSAQLIARCWKKCKSGEKKNDAN